MQTVSIHSLRGNNLRKNALKGVALAITKRGVLIGIFVPVAPAWVEHLIDYNWSDIHQSIVEGEQSLPTASAVATLDDVIPQGDIIDHEQGQGQVYRTPKRTESFERLQA